MFCPGRIGTVELRRRQKPGVLTVMAQSSGDLALTHEARGASVVLRAKLTAPPAPFLPVEKKASALRSTRLAASRTRYVRSPTRNYSRVEEASG
jgi:hypothetical protein